MTNQTQTPPLAIQWKKIVLAGFLASVCNTLLVSAIITGYAFDLAFRARGEPDPNKIEAFADQFTAWGAPISAIILTFLISLWIRRKIEARTTLHGLLIGLVAAVLNFLIALGFGEALDLTVMATFILIIGAGWLGSLFGPQGGQ